jgi:hypothetical protein
MSMRLLGLPFFFLVGGGAAVTAAVSTRMATADPVRPSLAELRELSGPKLAERLRAVPPDHLIALGRDGVRSLGSYRARLVKQERVGGELLPAQTIEVAVRPSPRALRLDYVAGPKAGRRLSWRENHRPAEMLVREGGLLSITSLWIDVGGKLARKDTNHPVMDLGFGPALSLFDSDLRKGAAQGGHTRRDRGFDSGGRYCIEYAAPPGAKGLYAERTVICIDPKLAVPVGIEVFDRQGLLERYDYANVRPNQKLEPSLFDDV